LDRLVNEGGPESTDAAARREALTGRFVDAFPADDRAPSLLVRRIAQDENPGMEDLDVLLGVPSTHPTWELARRRAVQMLYRSFRDARSGDRAEPGARMLEVADELLLRDRGVANDFAGADGMLLRQAAEVASHPEVHDAIRAARYLAQIETAAERGGFSEVPDIVNEAAYRRIGLALGGGDYEEASVRMLAMPIDPDTPEADRWARLASQLVHRMAIDRMRGGEVRVEVARAAVRSGERHLELQAEMLEEPGADGFSVLDRDRMLPFAASVAAARDALYRATGRLEDGTQALVWYLAVLERRPLDGSVLEATGDLAEALGESDVALDCWRRLARGANEGGELWWKARTAQIRTLLQIEPEAAVEVFDQLRALHPDLGPEPWRSELLDLQTAVDQSRELRQSTSSEGGA
ncbi:MAG: hypothetical protein VX672_00960, partial [Planctomycetota bacterium]|nr:hypothetical protein [Planctomycetota bacterium]